MGARILLSLLTCLVGAVPAYSQVSAVTLSTVAYRVHNQDAMVAFYSEAFGAKFRPVETGPIRSQFGEVAGITLKFVPIRDAADFDNFPVHQLGFEVADINRVIEIALRHRGRVQDQPTRTATGWHAAIRDPDGNTIELYAKR